MSRIAKAPISIPSGVEVIISGQEVTLKSGTLEANRVFNDFVEIFKEDNLLKSRLAKMEIYCNLYVQKWIVIGIKYSNIKIPFRLKFQFQKIIETDIDCK